MHRLPHPETKRKAAESASIDAQEQSSLEAPTNSFYQAGETKGDPERDQQQLVQFGLSEQSDLDKYIDLIPNATYKAVYM